MNKNPKSRTGKKNISEKKLADVVRLFGKKPTKVIAKETGVKFNTIRVIAARKGLKKENRLWTTKQGKELVKRYNEYGWQHFADKFKKTKWAVINKYRELTGKRK